MSELRIKIPTLAGITLHGRAPEEAKPYIDHRARALEGMGQTDRLNYLELVREEVLAAAQRDPSLLGLAPTYEPRLVRRRARWAGNCLAGCNARAAGATYAST